MTFFVKVLFTPFFETLSVDLASTHEGQVQMHKVTPKPKPRIGQDRVDKRVKRSVFLQRYERQPAPQ